MSTERVQIEVRQDGAQVVKRNLEEIGQAAGVADKAVTALKGVLAGLGVAALVRIGDEYANLQNKIRSVSTSLQNANQITQRLYDIAARSRSSIDGVVDAYFTLDVALAKYGVTQDHVATAVETLSKAFTAFGTGTEAAKLALVQLGQGFSKNRLETQDLKSVLQSAPPLIEILARNLNISGFSSDQLRFKLLALAEQGKITGTVMLKAIDQMAGEIDDKFAKSIKTIDQAVTVFSQNFKKEVGEILLNSGFTETISNGILSLANNIDRVIGVVTTLAAGFGTLILLTKGVSVAVGVLNAVLALNPFVAVISLAVAGAVAFYKFTTSVDETTASYKAQGAAGELLFNSQQKGFLGMASLRKKAMDQTKADYETMKAARANAEPAVDANVQKYIDDLTRENSIVLKLGDTYEAAKAQIQAFKAKGNQPLSDTEKNQVDTVKLQNVALERQKQVITEIIGPYQDYQNKVVALAAAMQGGFITLQQYQKGLDDALLAKDKFANQKTFSGGVEDGLKRELQALKGLGDQYTINKELLSLYNQKGSELTTQERERYTVLIQNRIEMERYKSLVEGIQKPQTDLVQGTKAINQALKDSAITTKQAALALEELQLAAAKDANKKGFTDTFVDQTKREIEVLKQSGDAYGVASGLLALYNQKGSELDAGQVKLFTSLIQTKLEVERQKTLVEAIVGPFRQYEENIRSLSLAFQENKINALQFNEALAQQELTMLRVKAAQETTFGGGYTTQLRIMTLETRNATADLGKQFATIFGPGGSLSKGIGDAVAQSIVFGKSFKESIRGIAQTILSQLISAITQIGVNMLLQGVIGQGIQAASTVGTVAQGAAITAAMTPAAAMTTLATSGTNAIGIGGILPGIFSLFTSFIGGFKDGGYTGPAGVNDIAGIVHGQEFVMNATATRAHRSTLEALNAGKDPATFVAPPSSPPVSVRITNEIPEAAYEVRQLGEQDIEIIARRIVRREAAEVIANDLRNPNSRTSKGISANTTATRRR